MADGDFTEEISITDSVKESESIVLAGEAMDTNAENNDAAGESIENKN